MRFLHRVRSLRGWPRALLAGLLLAFGFNAIAYAAHGHDPASTTTALHGEICSHCSGFGALATAPTLELPGPPGPTALFVLIPAASDPVSLRARSPARARAPPKFLMA